MNNEAYPCCGQNHKTTGCSTAVASPVERFVKRRPWLVQSDEVYRKKGGWEELGDFEHWLKNQLGDDLDELYEGIDPVLQSGLYVVFCNLHDQAV